MASKITFKPMGAEYRIPGDVTVTRAWEILRDGVKVGEIKSSIRDLFQSRENPGYSVTVIATIDGQDSEFRRNSSAFNNRSMREARENRSYYFGRAKEWARKVAAA